MRLIRRQFLAEWGYSPTWPRLLLLIMRGWTVPAYPLRLKDNQIRRETRIITVCDYYDALSSDRPYRAAMSRAETLAIIAANVGTTIDGDCYEALRQLL